ncbi:MAG: 3'-5' exonuclease [Spirochaetaceae bacterium]|jgi:DNA polymerase-3 subunit epsilon|nr:3'-5' exonuclease [Spirochaetaceae bacterium]
MKYGDFVALDFETADYRPDSACSIGLVKYINGAECASYYSLIRPPQLYIRPDFTEIHGLTVDDVKEAPFFSQIWDCSLAPFIGGLPVVCHNAAFDINVLRAVTSRYALKQHKINYFCSLKIARKIWPHFPSRALTALAGRFNIVYNAHNALDDARVCGKVVTLAAQELAAQNVESLLAKTGLYMQIFP